MFERILFKSSVEFVGDYVLFAALSAFIRREQLKQVGAATGQNHPMGRNLPLAHLIDEQQPTKGKNNRKKKKKCISQSIAKRLPSVGRLIIIEHYSAPGSDIVE